jgi:TPR repeat protein
MTATAAHKASAPTDDSTNWRGTCAICLDLLPVEANLRHFYECCCKKICSACSDKCDEYDTRCPLCLAPRHTSDAVWLRRLQKHVDKGHAEAQLQLGNKYNDGGMSLKKSPKRALQLYEHAAAQGHASAQYNLGIYYENGYSVKIDRKAATQLYQRAAEQGHPGAEFNLGVLFYNGIGVAQSYDEAARWYRLAAAQGHTEAIYLLGACHANGHGVPQDPDEALRLFKRAAAKGNAGAAAGVEHIGAWLAATRSD